jgi:DNA-binding response OmpR family regulator
MVMDEVQRVLVVDDHTDACELLCLHLEHLGHHCREANDGTSGLEIALELQPHIAILDLWLPDMSGHDVARALKLRDPHVYLIALTGSTRPEDRTKAFDSGFDEFLIKPADNRTLLDLIAKAKQRRPST